MRKVKRKDMFKEGIQSEVLNTSDKETTGVDAENKFNAIYSNE